MTRPKPLDGITVVSLEHAIAAPFCTRQLADLGARVIKVERPGTGDFARDTTSVPKAWPRTLCGSTARKKA
jgi:crotonobetainyl-CoA:carnitine CoA-transferase CaiB-like acyl-CoA transferase